MSWPQIAAELGTGRTSNSVYIHYRSMIGITSPRKPKPKTPEPEAAHQPESAHHPEDAQQPEDAPEPEDVPEPATASDHASESSRKSSPLEGSTAQPPWISRQRAAFGAPFLGCICIVYFAQGFRSLSALSSQFFLMNDLGLAPATIQNLVSITALPWSIKPL
jgi:hypothetical protein